MNQISGFVVHRDFRLPNGETIEKLGVYCTARTITLYVVKRNSAGDFDIEAAETFSHGGGGWQDVTLSTPFAIPATGDYFMAYFTATGAIHYQASQDRAWVFPGSQPASGNISGLTEDVGAAAFLRAYVAETGGGEEPTEMFEILGAIRNTGTGWFVIQDSGHEPINIASLSDQGSALRLTYGPTASKVGTLLITPDETYAQAGYSAGASVGSSYADIKFGQNGTAKNPSQVSSSSGNFWIYGKMWS